MFTYLLAIITLLTAVSAAKPTCLKTADHRTINKLFTDGGPGTKVFLCPGSTYSLSGTIVFTGADQEIATLGYPSGDKRATLSVANELLVTAIQGDCRRCARVGIRNLIIDGGRSRLGRSQDPAAPGLIVIGGNEGQSVRECAIKYPRGWTAIHVREGSKIQCKNAVIEKNEIGPAGEEYDPTVDGPDPEMSPLGRPLADGISIACRDSVVRDNMIIDCTDAGIVVYCSPGTLVAGNTIGTPGSSSMGGILMVDATPFDGDYKDMSVQDNILDASANIMRVGIGIGLSILSDDIETILRDGTVVRNALRGPFMGFGIAASGLENWTIAENWSEARHRGKRSARCFDDPVNPYPTAFLYHEATVTGGTVQPDFVDHDFAYIVCIDGLEAHELPGHGIPLASEVEQEDAQPEAEEDEEEEDTGTGNAALDGILLHSQMSMVEAISILGRRVDAAIDAARAHVPALAADGKRDVRYNLGNGLLLDLEARLDSLDQHHEDVIANARALRRQLKMVSNQMADSQAWQSDILLHIQEALQAPAAAAVPKPVPKVAKTEKEKQRERDRSEVITMLSGANSWVFVAAAVAILGIGYKVLRAWRSTRGGRLRSASGSGSRHVRGLSGGERGHFRRGSSFNKAV